MSTPGKVKQEPADDTMDVSTTEDAKLSYNEQLQFINPISQPMAGRKLAKKIYKLLKKASKHKGYVRNGLKDVQRRIRKGEKGIVVLAGDVTPLDIMCHMPAVCEEKRIPYGYTPSRRDLGASLGLKRCSIMVLIKTNPDYKSLYEEVETELKALPLPA
uniref:H/ACA snoRNP protein NHP2 n=1 Tax=Lynceus sp. MCZ IZ 141354 TaxID=1930659 RepID=A0A9N6WTD1_9CRUS|nr:EOG090X0JRW [Lynceus sp. MCZ IZ 141354]